MTKHPDSDAAWVLGVDLGTGGCKVCAVGRDGHVAGAGAAGYATLTPKAGWAEQDPETWMRAIADAGVSLLPRLPGKRMIPPLWSRHGGQSDWSCSARWPWG